MIDHIAHPSYDAAATHRFYSDVLGARLKAAFSGESAAGLWDLGAAFEWRFPAASLGLHATVDHLMGGGGWIEVGPHVEFRFLP